MPIVQWNGTATDTTRHVASDSKGVLNLMLLYCLNWHAVLSMPCYRHRNSYT